MSNSRVIAEDELEPLATGAWILGAGGGGNPYLSFLNIRQMYREGRLTEQAALAEFIAEGHFAAHLKRMRAIYRERRDTLRDILHTRLGDALTASGGDAGLHLLYYFNARAEDTALAAASVARGVVFRPLSIYYLDPARARAGMNLGYACVPLARIGPAADILCQVLEQGFSAADRSRPAGC